MLGRWKNYDELESDLSLEELMATINSMRDREKRERVFIAAINGIDLGENSAEPDSDIIDNVGHVAQKEGFGIGEGLGFMQMGGDD